MLGFGNVAAEHRFEVGRPFVQRQAQGDARLPQHHRVPRPALELVAVDLDGKVAGHMVPGHAAINSAAAAKKPAIRSSDMRGTSTSAVIETGRLRLRDICSQMTSNWSRRPATAHSIPQASRCGRRPPLLFRSDFDHGRADAECRARGGRSPGRWSATASRPAQRERPGRRPTPARLRVGPRSRPRDAALRHCLPPNPAGDADRLATPRRTPAAGNADRFDRRHLAATLADRADRPAGRCEFARRPCSTRFKG